MSSWHLNDVILDESRVRIHFAGPDVQKPTGVDTGGTHSKRRCCDVNTIPKFRVQPLQVKKLSL